VQLRLYELHYNLGHVLHQQGNLAGAAASYRQSLALKPDYASAHHSLGVALDEQGQHWEAVERYQQAIALQPNFIKSYNNLGCALAKLDRLEEAVQVYQQAIARQPDWAILHNNLGQALFEQSPIAAIAAYRRAIELQPDLALAHYNLGKALQFKGQHQQAITCFQQAIQLEFDSALALSDLSWSCIALNQWNRALQACQQAIVPQKLLIQAYCDWANQLQGQDQLSQARVSCAQFLQKLLPPQSDLTDETHNLTEAGLALAQTYLNWGNVLTAYGGKEQYQQAESYYQRALKLQPADLSLYSRLADCLVKQARLDAALLVCHFALAIHPHQPHLYTQLGQILEQQQQWEGAIAYYQKALAQPENPAEHEAQEQDSSNWHQAQPVQPSTYSNCPTEIYRTTQDWFRENPSLSSQYLSLQHPAPPCPAVSASSADACPGLNCAPCLKRIFDRFNLIHLGNGIHTCTGQTKPPLPAPPLFAAAIPNGKAWASPQQNSWQICNAIAILTDKHQLLSDLSREYPGQLPECRHSHPNHYRLFGSVSAAEIIPGTVAALAGLSGHNYFHWMVDILPRLEILRQHGIDWQMIDWFWLNSSEQPFQQQTLTALGIPAAKVLSSDRHPYIQADQLIAPSFPGHLGWVEPWALEFLRNAFLPSPPVQGEQAEDVLPKRLYISRNQADHRRVLNEAAVLQHLLPLGFVSIALETLAFSEQVALFSQAEVVIAPHGGGLTNILFCRPGTTVVELVSPRYIRHYYWVISDRLRLKHYFLASDGLTCEPIRQIMYPSPLTEDIWVDMEALEQLTHRMNLSS
jgi:tetratricopeptide (TPR) repeat protein/capsular polysaccharide biosynthesis protein